jgi:hypothetical protein
MGTQISHVVCAALIETFLSLTKEKGQPTVPPRTTQSESFLTATDVPRILKTSKPEAYGMISRKEIVLFSSTRQCRLGEKI